MQELIVITNQLGDFMTNCYTVYNAVTRDAVLIDPACNARFLNNILVNEQLNCVAILLTHGDYDHIGALPELMELVGHKVPIYASAEEEDVLNDPRILLQDDQEIELLDTKLRCFLVPGHTKGGMCYYFAENGILFSGDTLFARSIGRSDFPTGDGIKLVKSIKEKLMTLPDETIVYPGHNERTTIGKERNANPFIQ